MKSRYDELMIAFSASESRKLVANGKNSATKPLERVKRIDWRVRFPMDQ